MEDFDGSLDIIYWQPIFEQRQAERAKLQRERAAAAAAAAAHSGASEAGAPEKAASAHSQAEPPDVGPPTPQIGQGGTQAVDLALRIMVGSAVPSKRRPDMDRQAQPGRRSR